MTIFMLNNINVVVLIGVFCKNYCMNNKFKGKYGEEIAQKFLKSHGFEILETNYRYSKISEIDIIAQKEDILHFIEVKTRLNNIAGNPLEAITKTKIKSIIACSKFYMSNSKKYYKKYQIDAIGITIDNNEPQIEFLENIYLN